MTESNTILIWVVLFRTLQTALEAAPTLLCGLVVAGLIRGMIGPEAVRRWFTDDPRVGPVRAWFAGLLLPVCSFGVLPIAWELRRVKVPRATVITFLFAAPLSNPFSLISAFQSLEGEGPSGLTVLAFLLVGSFAITVGTGVLLGLWIPEAIATPDVPPLPATGFRRVGVVVLTVARGPIGILPLFLLVGAVGAGLLAVISGGALERAVNERSITAPLKLALVSIPFQATPARGTVLVCESLLSGVSVGSAFVIFLLGIGLNLGTLVWLVLSYGFRVSVVAILIVVGGALAVGYAFPVSLPHSASDSVKECHFLEIESSGGYKVARARAIRTTVSNDAGESQWFLIGTCATLGAFWLMGLVSSFLGERGTISHTMTRGRVIPLNPTESVMSKSLNAPQRTLAATAFVLVSVLAGFYIYYPAPVEILNQMDGVQVEFALLLTSDPIPRQQASRLAAQWQRLQSKLSVADLLRRGRLDAPVRASTSQLRSAIERLRAAIGDGSTVEELKTLCRDARESAMQCRKVFERDRTG